MELFKKIASGFKWFFMFCEKLHLRYLNLSPEYASEYTEKYIFYHIYRDMRKNCTSIFNAITECVTLAISFHLYFLRISKGWSMLHHRSVWQVQIRECYLMFTYTFVTFFGCFL